MLDLIYNVKIEQTFDYERRMKYIACSDSFIEKGLLQSFLRQKC